MFIAHCTQVFWEKVEMGIKKMDFQGHVAAHDVVWIDAVLHDTFKVFWFVVSEEIWNNRLECNPCISFSAPQKRLKIVICDETSYLWTNENTLFQFCITHLKIKQKCKPTSRLPLNSNMPSYPKHAHILLISYEKIDIYLLGKAKHKKLTFGNFSRKYRKLSLFLSRAFTKFFIRPSFMWRGGMMIFSRWTSGSWITFLLPGCMRSRICQFFLTKCCRLSLLSHSQIKQQNFV